jgi:tRNA pseudouridine55 synthase
MPEHPELLLIDKPHGITSMDVIRRLRRILNIKKIGHAGTLDPLATGLMLIGVGPDW